MQTDGSLLPAHTRAVLVILPEEGETAPTDWEHAFDAFFAVVLAAAAHPPADLTSLSEAELNALTHAARSAACCVP